MKNAPATNNAIPRGNGWVGVGSDIADNVARTQRCHTSVGCLVSPI